ncbi:Pyridine nucleotide-disulphide oxidoreductase [Bosea sp. OK403]|uniref:NAD(P)-binding domain-containing protein n=1 Tax=Bosea sp. OK403 TaxID=1855286 RepID=UPI0008E2F13F|nr:NAD(P)-binding domain-containing protein [Bosea sp. OK403]SFJ32423.1 Pyridine nucleotide-disulphide oxidoreductase [Bosea sp. OK403]
MVAIKTIAIIGAGPVGLAAAAHATERGLKPVVLEQGSAVGHAMRHWAHVPMFSPWAFNIDGAAERLLIASGWSHPGPGGYPTGGELIDRYLAPLAQRTALRDAIHFNARVLSVTRSGFDKVRTAGRESAPFALRYGSGAGEQTLLADAVIDASGTWFSPNPAGPGGLTALGEREAAAAISYGMPDVLGDARTRHAGKRVAVLGGGHSAIGTLIALADLQERVPETRIVWLYRGALLSKAFGGGAADQLTARGELGTRIAKLVERGLIGVETGFQLDRIERMEAGLHLEQFPIRLDRSITLDHCFNAFSSREPVSTSLENALAAANGGGRHVTVDELIVATGFRPDLALLRELRVQLDPALECPPALAPLIDPNAHSCGTVRPHGAVELAHPEPGFYIAGMKVYGRAPTFLLATGHEQVRSIVAEIAGDHAAARRVELVLPETGVCSTRPGGPIVADSGCCGGPAPAAVDACCADDARAKASGEAGCGCGGAPVRNATHEVAEA